VALAEESALAVEASEEGSAQEVELEKV